MTDMSHDRPALQPPDDVSALFVFLALGGFWVLLGVAGYLTLA